MSDTDAYVREAIQAKIQKDIEERVYEKIKGELRTWKFVGFSGSIVGGAAIALIVAFHDPLFKFIVDNGATDLKKQIEASTQQDIQALERQRITVEVEIEHARSELTGLTNQAMSARDEVTKINDELEKKRREAEELSARVNQLEDEVGLNQARVATALSKVAQQADGGQVGQNGKPGAAPSIASSEKGRATVYFQFAGFDRGKAVEISNAISKRGWDIPGQQRTPQAVGTNEIRYNPKDEDTAKQLKADSSAALRDLDMDINLALQSNPSVKIGIPEIWIWQR
jgi:hypothetical protein